MIKESIENIVKMNNEVYILGRLASGRNYYNGMLQRQDAVSRHRDNDNMIYFFVEALSDETDYCENILNKDRSDEVRELYIGIDTQQLELIHPFGYISSHQMKYKYLSALEKE